MSGNWTTGPLAVRRINSDERPFAIINQTLRGDELVAGFISNEADAILYTAAPDMAEALEEAILVLSALSPEDESLYGPRALTLARAALQKARGQ